MEILIVHLFSCSDGAAFRCFDDFHLMYTAADDYMALPG